MIHIALAVHDLRGTYSRHAGVLIASILRNTCSPVCIHVLCDETLSDVNREKLRKTFYDNVNVNANCDENSRIDFVDMSECLKRYKNIDLDAVGGVFTRGAMYRLCMPEVLVDVDMIIYFDCDVAVNLDVAQLWNEQFEMGGRTFAGVREQNSLPMPDMNIPRENIKTDRFGASDDRYINSGVLLMNLKKLRSEYNAKGSLLERSVEYVKRLSPPYPDQDFLNAEYIGDIYYISDRYNRVPIEDYNDVLHYGQIWHFFSKGKPWNLLRGSNADMLYWQNLMYTPWRDELVESFYKAAVENQYYHRHSKACMVRLWEQLIGNIKNAKRMFKSNSR